MEQKAAVPVFLWAILPIDKGAKEVLRFSFPWRNLFAQ